LRFRNGVTRIRNSAKTRERAAIEGIAVQPDSAHLGKGLAGTNEVQQEAGKELA